jgi:sugar phosphate isomerase/epimerase
VDSLPGLERLSLNQITTQRWSLPEAVDGCVRSGISAIGLWRDKVAEVGVDTAVALVRQAGLRVSSLCRGGFFPAADAAQRRERQADNRRAVDEAAALGADALVLVCGGQDGLGLDTARDMVGEGIADLLPYAADREVRLAIEPLHPMYCADRSVIVTLRQALDLAERFPPEHVGVVVDTFHIWWDPEVDQQIRRAAGRIAGFQLCDWLVPLPDVLLGRGLMGDGHIDFPALARAVDAAGYDGPIEVEILNRAIWDTPGDTVLDLVKQRFTTHVAEPDHSEREGRSGRHDVPR